MCVICDRLSMRVISIDFSKIPAEEKERIIQAIESAYDGTDRRAYVIEEHRNNFKLCPAYRDKNGGQALVHFGHCTGAFPGIEKCPYYNQSGGYSDEACRLRVRRGLV